MTMHTAKQKNYNAFLSVKMEMYIGEWVVICDGKIISHGKDLKVAVAQAKKICGSQRIMIAKVPDKETMIY